MGIETAIGVGASLVGSMMGADSAESAADTQAAGARYAADVQRETFKTINDQQKPYREAGYDSLSRLRTLLPSLISPISANEIQNLPGYQFTLGQGMGAARQNMNVGGGGSNVDRAAQKFAIDYTMGSAMPQVMAQRQNIYNTLAGIAGIGQTAQGQVNSAGQNMANNVGQAAIGGASASAAGQIGASNAWSSGLGNIANMASMYSLMKG